MNSKLSHFIRGQWIAGAGSSFVSTDPATGAVNWSGHAAERHEVDSAVAAARDALPNWGGRPYADRTDLLQAVAREYEHQRADLVKAICLETGKPKWEALTEVDVMIAKIAVSIEAFERRTASTSTVSNGVTAATRYKPHGVVAVLGPFNMPGHLPNGHIIPALLAGNTVVFKPSEQTPLVGQVMAEVFEVCGFPAGAFNLVQGAAQTGIDLANHGGIDGVFFTGSAGVGKSLSRALADQPGKILALEMGGNNPLLFHDCADIDAAAYATIQCAYISSGQRCSCARRLIVSPGAQGDAFIARLIEKIAGIRVGFCSDDPEPFMGPVIHGVAAQNLLAAQAKLVARGGKVLVEMRLSDRSPALLTPGLIDVTTITPRDDVEHFGPILQVIRVSDFPAALHEANQTRYGLSAGLMSDRRELYDQFFQTIRAGVVNWNRPLTGASSRLPFGGLGDSGNHRPSAYFAADYCSYPVGSMEIEKLTVPAQLPPGIS